MAVNQVQIRRDSAVNLLASTPTDGELGYDQTNKRIVIGDNTKAGGQPIPSIVDIQNNRMNAMAGGGTADAHTLTFSTALALTAYAAYQRFQFIANATNTTTATLNVNGLGAKTIKKVADNALTNLEAGDITSGLIYDVMYDGTYFVVMNANVGRYVPDSITGDYVESNDAVPAADQSVTTTPTKVLEFIAGRDGVYNVLIVSDATSDGNHHLRVYKNGAAEGTNNAATAATRTQFYEDITVVPGDLIQLYASADSGTVDIGAADFAILSGNPTVASVHEEWVTSLKP